MKLFVGLGNPGKQYAGHRHNVGFMALDVIAARYSCPAWRNRFHSEVAEGTLDGTKVLLIKPQTYMNESGQAVGEAMRFFKLDPEDVTVFHDELDLAPGKLKVKTGGGAAGHNGLRSITQHIGADFERVRIGIGHPGHKDRVHSYVLNDFAKADKTWLEPLLDEMARAAGFLAAGDAPRFMSEVARHLTPPKDKKEKSEKPTSDAAPAAPPPDGERRHSKWDFVEKATRGDGPLADKLKGLFKRSDDN